MSSEVPTTKRERAGGERAGTTRFPDLHRTDTMELPIICAGSGILAGLLFSASWKLGLVVAIPAILIATYAACVLVINTFKRISWARKTGEWISSKRALELVRSDTGYAVEIELYGGFDCVRLMPMAMIRSPEGKVYAVPYVARRHIDELRSFSGKTE